VSSKPGAGQTDLCVVTALSLELNELRQTRWNWNKAEVLDGVSFFYRGTFTSGGRTLSVVAASAPRMGMVPAAIVSLKLISKFRPRLFAMVGICAGLENNCGIGDVLLADPTWDWQMGKYTEAMFQIAPDQIDIPTEVVERFKLLGDDRAFWFNISDRFAGEKPNRVPELKIGPVSSGSAVLADARLLDEIKKQHRKLLGIEMELYGVYLAAKDCQPPHPITFGLKGVSDFAGTDKSDKYQRFAAHMSVNTLAAFCERFASDLCPK
jgi:nucleoside phosphorylase